MLQLQAVKYPCTIKRLMGGEWQARTMGTDVGTLEVIAPGREQALEQLAKEIRYRLEWCPCSGIAEDHVELDVREATDRLPGSAFSSSD